MCQEGNAFRGEYLNHCAQVEAWAVGVFTSNAAIASGLLKARPPHLFGQKLKAIGELADAESPVFSKPKRVSELLIKFEPYAKLRAELAHAVMTSFGTNPPAIFAFSNPSGGGLLPLGQRFWLTPLEARDLLAGLKRLAKEICDQKVKD